MKKIILSPPFSNIYRNKLCSNIIGTYTSKKRSGLHRVITTLRPTKGGWYNQVGLRNPGIKSLYKKYKEDDIVSVYFENIKDWDVIFTSLQDLNVDSIELNISCPNHIESGINQTIINEAVNNFKTVSVKIPHGENFKFVNKFYNSGISLFHISNASKTPYGGLSGTSLVYNNTRLIKQVKRNLSNNVKVIGGGGIYNVEIADMYLTAGADYLSLSTALLNPFKLQRLINDINERF